MLHQASDIATSTFDARPHVVTQTSEPDPFDGGCPADTERGIPFPGGKAPWSPNADADHLRSQIARAEAENKRLVKKNQLLLKAIADISRELDDLVHRCGLIASGATAN